jgi:DNA (cytosine-5)-methyltransferase 1
VKNGLIGDLFAGGGGASVGIEAAFGRKVDFAINHNAVALAVHAANHPNTKHLTVSIWDAEPKEVCRGRHLMFLWASPDCTHFSVAKGGKPRKQNIRSLAHAVVEWARDVRPDVIMLENVQEFVGWGPLDSEGQPIKARMGESFQQWKGRLELLGYQVDHRVLDASLYGAPTRRRRLFLIARCDGEPIVWPEPTHGTGKLPVHTAAECIDWSLPCPSIFERSKPLAEKTLWRIAQGIKKFVLENPTPFIVGAGGRARQTSPTPADAPLGTVTAKNDRGVVLPVLATIDHRGSDATAYGAGEALKTTTTKNRHAVIAPVITKVTHGKHEARGESPEEPLSTVTAGYQGHAMIAPVLVNTRNGERKTQAARVFDVRDPMRTVTAKGSQGALVTAFLNRHFTGVVGCKADQPIPTITAVDHHSITTAKLEAVDDGDRGGTGDDSSGRTGGAQRRDNLEAAQPELDAAAGAASRGDADEERLSRGSRVRRGSAVHAGSPSSGVDGTAGPDSDRPRHQPPERRQDGQPASQPRAGHAQPEHSALLSSAGAETAAVDQACAGEGGASGEGVARAGADVRGHREGAEGQPNDGVQGHVGEVRAFLVKYFNTGIGQPLTEPAHTITTKHRLGLVTVEGVDYQIVDIGFRMLEPHELLRAQFGKFAADYDLSAAKTKRDKVRLIGNSVCPELVEQLVRANLSKKARRAA